MSSVVFFTMAQKKKKKKKEKNSQNIKSRDSSPYTNNVYAMCFLYLRHRYFEIPRGAEKPIPRFTVPVGKPDTHTKWMARACHLDLHCQRPISALCAANPSPNNPQRAQDYFCPRKGRGRWHLLHLVVDN